jgi:hypothetical protein
MAGPFPGMDPYLEDPVLWSGVHQGLITRSRNTLNRLLPDGYAANIGERLNIFKTAEVREVFIEILPVGEETRVVTVIEVLSHINKARGSEGHELYLTKQRELLQSGVNLIEIDLLRRGEHTAAVPHEELLRRGREDLLQRGRWDYLVCLHRSGQRGRYETWPRTVRERLPRIWIPLENGLPDITLDLQEVFDHNYDDGAYRRRIDYGRVPIPPMDDLDTKWADALLKSAGLRS